MPFTAFLFMCLAAFIAGAACYAPRRFNFSSDHTVGTMFLGAALAAANVGMAIYCLTRP